MLSLSLTRINPKPLPKLRHSFSTKAMKSDGRNGECADQNPNPDAKCKPPEFGYGAKGRRGFKARIGVYSPGSLECHAKSGGGSACKRKGKA